MIDQAIIDEARRRGASTVLVEADGYISFLYDKPPEGWFGPPCDEPEIVRADHFLERES